MILKKKQSCHPCCRIHKPRQPVSWHSGGENRAVASLQTMGASVGKGCLLPGHHCINCACWPCLLAVSPAWWNQGWIPCSFPAGILQSHLCLCSPQVSSSDNFAERSGQNRSCRLHEVGISFGVWLTHCLWRHRALL